MKAMGWIAAASVLALAGCSSSGGGGGGGPIMGTVFGVPGTASKDEDGPGGMSAVAYAPVAADAEVSEDAIKVTFEEGSHGLAGRSLTFSTDTGEATAGQNLGETADLKVLFNDDKAAFAGLIIVSDADFDDDDSPTGSADYYAFYGGDPRVQFSAPDGNQPMGFQGKFVGVAAKGDNAGDVEGTIDLNVDFATDRVEATISDLGIVDDVWFAAEITSDTYRGSSATRDATKFKIGNDEASGFVEGGFFGPGAAETAGAIFVESGDSLVMGGYRADDVTP